uniref:Uncharacterized protein n=1 Tax=Peronospora matthiolae TaxID=2874970 RepID=A0AAV1V0Y9_9STRA
MLQQLRTRTPVHLLQLQSHPFPHRFVGSGMGRLTLKTTFKTSAAYVQSCRSGFGLP